MDSHIGNTCYHGRVGGVSPTAYSRAARGAVLLSALAAALLALVLALTPPAALAATRAVTSLPVYEYVQYGVSPEEVANIYPSSRPGSPVVVLVHGGGWRKQRTLSRFENQSQALRADGMTVFEINYDQDSAATPAFPLEPNDIDAATRWAVENAAKYNGDPSRLVLLGGSAGGNLVALAAERLNAASPELVKGVVVLSGPANFISLVRMIKEGQITNPSFDFDVYQALGFEPPERLPKAFAEEWSPALHAPNSSCSSWLIFNSEDELIPLSQAQEMYAALQAAKCRATLTVVPGTLHAFEYFPEVKPQIEQFIGEL
jgi:acetyl esterase/lipase